MEIAGLVDNEHLFKLELKHPKTDKPTGITMMIRSASSPAAMVIVRRQTDDLLERQQRRKLVDAERVEENEIEQAVSYISSWDWGADPDTGKPNTYKGAVPTLSANLAAEILQGQGWIYSQVVGAARSIANFTQTSATNSALP